jgi:hypothetical protein
LKRKRQLVRHKHIWDDGIRTVLSEDEWEYVAWNYVAQYRGQWRVVVNTAINLRVPRKRGEFLDQLSDYQLLVKK